MNEILELTIDTAGGIIDCRLEPDDAGVVYEATILYPCVVDGYSRSDIFCCSMSYDAGAGRYVFADKEDMHPKIQALESKLSATIANADKSRKR